MTKTYAVILCPVLILASGCTHLVKDSGKSAAFISQAARVGEKAPGAFQVPDQDKETLDDTYMGTKADYHFTMAESYSLQGDSSKAVENYKLALVYDAKSSQIRYRLALEYVKLGLVTEAISQCKEALRHNSKHKDSGLLLGGLLSAMHLYDEALATYQNLLKTFPDDLDTLLFIGALYAEKGLFDKSIDHFKAMVGNKKLKDKSQVWYYLGRVYSSKQNPDFRKAETAFVTSLKLDPEPADVVLALGAVYESTEQIKKLRTLYADYQREQGANHVIAERLAQAYLDEDKLDKAVEQLKVVESYDYQNLNISLKIALIMIEQKKYQPAISKLESILSRYPNSDKVRFYLGALYEEIKDYPAAIQQFETIPFGSSYFEDSVMHVSYLYKLSGKMDEAIDWVERGIASKGDIAKFWVMHGSLLDEDKQYSKAEEVLAKAAQKFPKDPQILFQLGSLYDRTGKKDKTVEQMLKVLEIDENHVQALNYLAYVYADGTRNLAEAEELVRKALKLQPDDGFIMDTLGWVLYKQDRLPEAIKVLEKVHSTESNEAIIAEHLGDAYFKTQLPRKAKKMYLKAVALETDGSNKEKIQSKILSIDQKLQAEESRKKSRFPASN